MLVTVVVTFRFSNPSTLMLGVEVLTVKPGVAETATVEATRAMRRLQREWESIVMAGGEANPMASLATGLLKYPSGLRGPVATTGQ